MSWLKKLDKFLDSWHLLYGSASPVKAKENAPVWGKQDEWVPLNPDRRTFHVDVSDLPSEKAEEFLAKMREKLNEKKCCSADPEICETKSSCRAETFDPVNLFHVKGSKDLKAVVLVYLDVGTLPPNKAEAYIQKKVEAYKPLFNRLPEDVGVMFLPNRTHTAVEYILLDGGEK